MRDAAEFRRLIDDAKARYDITDIAGRDRKVVRAGKEHVALCAFHNERSPSMRLNNVKGTFHCFGCGASGDIVKYVMETQAVGFIDALRWLGAADLPPVDPAKRARAAEEDAADREAAIDEARAVWERAVPAPGTPAAVYARSRGITMPLPASIRFVETYAWRDRDTGEVGPNLPAMVGAVTNVAGEVVAIQRIFLRKGGAEKARMRTPKLTLGRVKGGALRLDHHLALRMPSSPYGVALLPSENALREVIITEGPEDGLSLAQELPDARVWVALGTALMPAIDFGPGVAKVVIAGQNDAAGRLAVDNAAIALAERGLGVRTMFPDPAFKDWNDQLRGIRA